MSITTYEIAEICHEANRAYCHIINDAMPARAWDDETDTLRESAIHGVQAIIKNPVITPEQLHEKWLADKRGTGWVWGPNKDEKMKTHPCFLPYAELPAEQKVKDHLFRAIALTLLA